MKDVKVKKASQEELNKLKVKSWGIWTCEPSEFDWAYADQETCYFLAGKVTVSVGKEQYTMETGDLVTFSKGLSCHWQVHEAVKKHYRFE